MDFIKKMQEKRKNTIFDIFSQIPSLRTKTTKEKVDQDNIWNFLNQKKIKVGPMIWVMTAK